MNCVIYARYSSWGQREASIEAQIAACLDYAKENNMSVIEEYIDRASSATNDNRIDFQRMISDSEEGLFEVVLVYQFDRFSRNRFDSAIYKGKLKDNGVRVVSVKENITDDPSGALLEGLLETLGEFYSNDLAVKVKRGQKLNAEKCLFNGGSIPLGYKVDETKRFVIDEEYAPIVRHIFENFVDGMSLVDIAEELNLAGIKTKKNTPFVARSLQTLIRNKRYTGIYIYGETEIEGGIPQIISREIYDAAQEKLGTYKHSRTSKGNYLLTGKLYCGMCKNIMVGVSGTSKLGATYNYYTCQGKRQKICAKKSVRQDYIEPLVLEACRSVLSDENISMIAKEVSALCEKEASSPYLKQMKKELKTVQTAIENLMNALERGDEADLILDRIKKKRTEKETLEAEIAKEELGRILLSEDDIKSFYIELRNGSLDNKKYQKMLVNTLINKIFLYDDKTTFFFNAGNKPVEITEELREESAKKESPPIDSGGVRIEQPPLRHETIKDLISLSGPFLFPSSSFALIGILPDSCLLFLFVTEPSDDSQDK